MKRSMLCLFSIICAIMLLYTSSSFAANTIKVGFVDAYSGPAAPYCLDVVEGFKMAADVINAKGGVLGKKIEYVTRDDKWQPSISLSMAKELVMRENVDMLMGTANSACALAVSDFARKEKVPLFVYAKSTKITGEMGHRYVFAISENTGMVGKAAGAVLAKKPYTKYWAAGDDYEYSRNLGDSVFNNVKAHNPKVQLVGQSWWKLGEADFTPYITQIMAAKPDLLIAATGGASMIGFQKAAKATGLAAKIPIYQHTSIEFVALLANGLEVPEGLYGTANYLFYYPQTPENKAFVDEYRKIRDRYPTQYTFYGYMTAQFVARAYQKAGTVDREKFVNALEGLVLENSPAGRLELRACDHQLLLPTYFGVTKKVPEYKDFLIGTDITTVAPQDGVPSCEEVQKLRAQAK